MTAIALFADRNVIAPTHVAVASTLGHWGGPSEPEIFVFQSGWRTGEIAALHATASMQARSCRLEVREIDLGRVSKWKHHYSTLMPYGRLFLPELLKDRDYVFYMDVDTIVEVDLMEVIAAVAGQGPVAALEAWDFQHSMDADLARELGIDPQGRYFHSGLLSLDLEWCRENAILEEFLRWGDRFSARLNSHDQTILNFVLKDRLASIPSRYSNLLYPTTPAIDNALEVIHSFCGSPKPFDPLGNLLNDNYAAFRKWMDRTAISSWSPNQLSELVRLRKNLRLMRPVLGSLLRRLNRKEAAET